MNWHRKVLAALVLLILVLTTLPVAMARPNEAADKIEAALLDKFALEAQVDFIVRFNEQADLTAASTLNWADRGEFVYDTLTATAERTQARAIALLDARGLYHETYVAGNDLYVRAGNLEAANLLAGLPEVSFVRATRTYYIDPYVTEDSTVPSGPDALAWGIVDAKADQFWATFGVQGDGIKVANIDTGVQYNHPALDQAFACATPTDPACWRDPSNICGASGACDNNGHGTHTMGTMVADDDPSLTWQAGMAPNATWIACKGCESTSCSDTALNACADWILAPGGNTANRPHVVNNSWGGGGGDAWYQAKVQAWQAAGIFPAFSSGNSTGCSSMGSPGDYQESFATTGHDSSRVHAWSQGPSAFGHEPYTKPNITAPSVSVCSTVPTNAWSCGYSGTSMASPHSAGAVALLWSCNPSLVGQVYATFEALQSSADAPNPANPACGVPPDGEGTYEDGYGYLNVYQAGLFNCGGVQVGYLDGYVYEADGTTPIAGADVSAVPVAEGLGYDALTDPTGYYTMPLTPGTYDVTASKNGYASQTASGVVIVADTVTSQDFTLSFLGTWMPGPAMCFDLTRIDAEFFPATGKVYILGGRSDTNTFGNIYSFDPATEVCVDTGAVMPFPVSNYTISMVNNGTADVLCTFGGRGAAGTPILNVQCYDPIANTATSVATLPSAWSGYSPGGQEVVDNMVYIFGGFNSTTAPYMTARTERFDPTTNTFTQLGNLSLARAYMLTGVVDGKIYAFGGDTFDGAALIAQTRAEVMADPGGAGTWDDAAVADLPIAGDEGRGFAYGSDSIYPYAGQIVLATLAQWQGSSAEVIKYDVASDSYDTSFPDLINSRRNHAGVLVPLCTEDPSDGLPGMWVLGGYFGSDQPPYAPAEYYPLPCATAPVAQFSWVEPVCVDTPEQFTDESTGGPTEWAWDFGDGGTAVVQHPVYTYTAPGDVLVTLVVSNTVGWSSVEHPLTVNPLPVADFTAVPASGYAPLEVVFTFTGQDGTPSWDFGDGTTGTGGVVTHTYVATGTFTVVVTATSEFGCGVDTATGTVEVLTPGVCVPVSIVAVNQAAVGCVVDFSADLTGDEPFTYTWDLGVFGTFDTPTATVDFGATGTYTGTLEVWNCGGAASDVEPITVDVTCEPPAVFTIYLPVVYK